MAALQDNDFLESVEDIEANIMVIEKPDESTDSQSETFEVDLTGQEFSGTGFSKSTEKCVKFAVSLLKAWCTSNGESADIENMTSAELNEVLGKFYSNVRTKTGDYYSFSSLTSFRYSLNRFFQSMAEGKRFDIIENPEFFNSNEIFSTVIKSLKLKSTDKGDKNKLFLTSDELRQIYLQVFAEDSPKTLQYKVWFEVAVYFNKGGRSKQRVLTKNSFIFGNDAFGKFVFLKKDAGSDSSMNNNKDGRKMYEKRNHPLCPVLSLAKYLSKLHPETMDLFQRPKYKISKSASVWYYHQPVGKNFLGNVMYLICTQAGISKQVSNKCLKNITPEVLDACVFAIPLNKLGIPKSVSVPAIMELKKRTSTKQASSTVSQMDRFAAGDSSSQCSDIYETHGQKITYEEAKQEIQNLFQKFTPKVLGDVMLWLKNVDFSKDITGELICEDNSHFVTSQVQYNNSILSRGFQPNTYQLPPSQLPLSLNYTLPRYPLTPIPLKTVGPYNNMPQPSSVPRQFHPPAQNFVYNYSNRGLCSSLSTPVSSILPPSNLHHNPTQIGMRIPHEVNVNNHNYNMGCNSTVESLSPQNIPPPVVSHGRVLSPTFISSPFSYSNSTTLLNLNNNPHPNETALDTGTKHTWSTMPSNLHTNQTGDGNTWPGNDVRHQKVKKASKQKRRRRRKRHFLEEMDAHRQMFQRELPVVFPWLETNGNPYEYMYFVQGREQLQGHMNTLINHANDQGHMNTLINHANDQGHMNTCISNANNQGHMNTCISNANNVGHMNACISNVNNQGHMNTCISNANNQDHMNTFVNSNDPGHVNMFVTNVSPQIDDSRILVNNVTPFESGSAITKGKNPEIKRKSNSSETETSNQASNFGTPIQKKVKYGFEPKTPEPNFRIVSVVSMSEENDAPKKSSSTDLSMYETVEAKKYFNYLGLDLVPKKQISQRHVFQNQNNSNSICQQQPDFQRSQNPLNKEFEVIDNFQSDQDFTRYCTADKDGFLIKVTLDKQNSLPVCSRCEFKILRKIKKYGRNFGHKICHHLDRDIAYYEALNQNKMFDLQQEKVQAQTSVPIVDQLSAQSPESENTYSPISDTDVPDDEPLSPTSTTEAKENIDTQRKNSDQESITHVPENTNLESDSPKTAENVPKPIQKIVAISTEFGRPTLPEINADNTININKLPIAKDLKPGPSETTTDKIPSPFQSVKNRLPAVQNLKPGPSANTAETILSPVQGVNNQLPENKLPKAQNLMPEPSATTEDTIPTLLLATNADMNQLPARTESDNRMQVNQARPSITPDLMGTKAVVNRKVSSESNEQLVRENKDQPHGVVTQDNTIETCKRNENNKIHTCPNEFDTTDISSTQSELTKKLKSDTTSMKSDSTTMCKEQLINIAQIKEDLFLSDEETNRHIPYPIVQHIPKGNCQLQEDLYISESDTLSQDSIQACDDQQSINTNPSHELAMLPMEDSSNGMKKQVPFKSISDKRLITEHTDTTLNPYKIISQNQAVMESLKVKHQSSQSPKEDQVSKDESVNVFGITRNLEQDVLGLPDNQTEQVSPVVDGQLLTQVQEELKRDILLMPEWIKLSQMIKESKDSQAIGNCRLSGSNFSTKRHHKEGKEETRRSASHAFRKLKANMLIRKLQRKKDEYLKKKLDKISEDEGLVQLDETQTEDHPLNIEIDNESRQESPDKAREKAKIMVSLPLKYFESTLKSKNAASDRNERCQDNFVDSNKNGRRSDSEEDILISEDQFSEDCNPPQKRNIQAETQVKDRFSTQNSPNCSTTLDKASDNGTGGNFHILMSGGHKRPENEFEKTAEDGEVEQHVNEKPQYGNNGTQICYENIYQSLSADENELNDVDPCFLNKSVASIFTSEEGSPEKSRNQPEKRETIVMTPKEQPRIKNIEIPESTDSNRDPDIPTKTNMFIQQISDAERRSGRKTSKDTEEVKNVLDNLTETLGSIEETGNDSSKTNADKRPGQKNLETKCYFVNPIYKSMINRKLLDIKNSEFVKKLHYGSKGAPLSKEDMILKINKCFNEARKQKKQNNTKIEASKADNVAVAFDGHNVHVVVADQMNANSFQTPSHDDPPSLSQFRTQDSRIRQKGGTCIRKDKATPMISEANIKEHHSEAGKFSNPLIRQPLGRTESKLVSAKDSDTGKKRAEESKTPYRSTVSSQNVPDQTNEHPSRECYRTSDSLFGTSIKVEKLSPETPQSKRMHDPAAKKHNKLKLDKSKGQAPKKVLIKEEPVSPKIQTTMTPKVSRRDQRNEALKISPISPLVKLTKNSSPKLTISNVYSLNQADPKSTVSQERRLSKMGKSGITGTSATPFQTGSSNQTDPISNGSRASSCTSTDKENGKRVFDDQDEEQYPRKNKVTSVKARSNFPCINGGAFRPVQRTISSDWYPLQDQTCFQAHSREDNNNPQTYLTPSSGPTNINLGKASPIQSQMATNQFLGITQAPKPSSTTLQKIPHPITTTRGMGTKNQLTPGIIRPECIHPQRFTNHPLLRMNYQPTLNPECKPHVPSFRPLHLPDSTSHVRVPAEMVRMYAPRFQKIPRSNTNLTTVGEQYPVLHSRLAAEATRKDNAPQNEGTSSTADFQHSKGLYTIASSDKADIAKEVQVIIPVPTTSVSQVNLKERSKQNIHPGKVLPASKMPHASVIRKAKPSSSSYTIHDFENLNPWNSEENQTVTSANQTPLKSPKVLSKKAYLMKRSTNPGVLSKSAKPIAKKSPLKPNSVNSTVQLSKVQKYFQNKLSNLFKTSINVTKVTDAKGQPVTPTKLMQGQVPVYIRYERKESGQRKTSVIMGRQNRTSSADMDFYDLESAQLAFQKFQKESQQKEQSGNLQITNTCPVTSSNVESAKTASDAAKMDHPPKDTNTQRSSSQAERTISNARTRLTKQLLPAHTTTPSLQTNTNESDSTRTELTADPQKLNVKRTPSKKKKKKTKIIDDAKANDQHSEINVNSAIDKTDKEKQTTKRIVLQECIKQISKVKQKSQFTTEYGSIEGLPESELDGYIKPMGKNRDSPSIKKLLNKENNRRSNPGSSNCSAVSSKAQPLTHHMGQLLKIQQRGTQSAQSNRATYTIAQRDAIMNAISAYFQHRASGKVKNIIYQSSNSEASFSTDAHQHAHVNRSTTGSTQPPQQSSSHSTTIPLKPIKVVWPREFDVKKASSESDLTKVVHVKSMRRPRKQILTPMADFKGSDYFLTSNSVTRTTEDGTPLDLSLVKGSKMAVDISPSEVITQDLHTKPTLNNARLVTSECTSASKRKSEEPVPTTNESFKVLRKSEDAPASENITTIHTSRDITTKTKKPSRDPRTVKRRVAPEASTIVTAEYSKSDNGQQSQQQQQQKRQNEIHQRSDSQLVSKEKCYGTVHPSSKVSEDHQQTLIQSKARHSSARSLEFSTTRYCMGDVPLHSSKACTNLLEDNLAVKEDVSFVNGTNLNSFPLKDGLNRSDALNQTETLSTDVDVGARKAAPYKDFQSTAEVFKLKPCSVVINKDVVYPLELQKDQTISDKHSNEEEINPGSTDDDAQSEEHEEDDDIFDSQATQILGDSRPLEEVQNTSKRKRHETESFSVTTRKNNKLLLRIKLGDHHRIRKQKKHGHFDEDNDSEIQDTDDEENVGDGDSESHHPSDVYQSDEELGT